MAFISGPRQVGKTTLAKSIGSEADKYLYKNWDELSFRKLWTKNPSKLLEELGLSRASQSTVLVLDEIHKCKGWKQKLKGLYDEASHVGLTRPQLIVTGSARLNVYRKGGDSLMGRYLHFRLHPFSLSELENIVPQNPDEWRERLFKKAQIKLASQKSLERLMEFGGFPEPLLANNTKILNIWRQGRIEKIVREDLRDLSRIPELSQVEMLMSLLPDKVGSALSVQSLREDLEVSFDTVKRWLQYLQELYYFFDLRPWTKSVARSLKKEPKIYLYDWSEVESTGPRFENLMASQLMKTCHFWTDTGEGNFELFYLRNKEKQEIDFLIVKNKKPWLCVEAKTSSTTLQTKTIDKFQAALKVPFVQVLLEADQCLFPAADRAIMSAQRFCVGLP